MADIQAGSLYYTVGIDRASLQNAVKEIKRVGDAARRADSSFGKTSDEMRELSNKSRALAGRMRTLTNDIKAQGGATTAQRSELEKVQGEAVELRGRLDSLRGSIVSTSADEAEWQGIMARTSGIIEQNVSKIGQAESRYDMLGAEFEELTTRLTVLGNEMRTFRDQQAAMSPENFTRGMQTFNDRAAAIRHQLDGMNSTMNLSTANTKRMSQAQRRASVVMKQSRNAVQGLGGAHQNLALSQRLSYGASTLLNDRIFQISPALGILTNQLNFTTQGFRAWLASILPIVAAAGALIGVIGGLVVSLKSGVALESALADVRKTTNFTNEELGELTNRLQEISMEVPTTVDNMLEIARVAGQLGIRGVDNVTRFTETISKLSVATDVVGEQGATNLARFLQALGTDMDDMGQETERVGNILNQLENTTAATAAEILQMTSFTQGLSSQAGATETEILALNAALLSLGVKAEAGGSAVVRTIGKIQEAGSSGGEALERFAEQADMSNEEFRNLARNAPVDALRALAAGMSQTAEEGGNLNDVLNQLSINEVRERRALLALAQGTETLENAMGQAQREAFLMGSLMQEVEVQADTVNGKLRLLGNRFVAVGQDIGMGLTDPLKGLIDTLIAAADHIDILAGAVVGSIALFGLKGLAGVVGKAATALRGAAAAAVAATTAIGGLRAAIASLMSGPFGIIALGAVLGGSVALGMRATRDSASELGDEMESLEETVGAVSSMFERVRDRKDLEIALDAISTKLEGEAREKWDIYKAGILENIDEIENLKDVLDEALEKYLDLAGEQLAPRIGEFEAASQASLGRVRAMEPQLPSGVDLGIDVTGSSVEELTLLLSELRELRNADTSDFGDALFGNSPTESIVNTRLPSLISDIETLIELREQQARVEAQVAESRESLRGSSDGDGGDAGGNTEAFEKYQDRIQDIKDSGSQALDVIKQLFLLDRISGKERAEQRLSSFESTLRSLLELQAEIDTKDLGLTSGQKDSLLNELNNQVYLMNNLTTQAEREAAQFPDTSGKTPQEVEQELRRSLQIYRDQLGPALMKEDLIDEDQFSAELAKRFRDAAEKAAEKGVDQDVIDAWLAEARKLEEALASVSFESVVRRREGVTAELIRLSREEIGTNDNLGESLQNLNKQIEQHAQKKKEIMESYRNSLDELETRAPIEGMTSIELLEAKVSETVSSMVELANAGAQNSDRYKELEGDLVSLRSELRTFTDELQNHTDVEEETREQTAAVIAHYEALGSTIDKRISMAQDMTEANAMEVRSNNELGASLQALDQQILEHTEAKNEIMDSYESSLGILENREDAFGLSGLEVMEARAEILQDALDSLADEGMENSKEFRGLESELESVNAQIKVVTRSIENLTNAEREVREETQRVIDYYKNLEDTIRRRKSATRDAVEEASREARANNVLGQSLQDLNVRIEEHAAAKRDVVEAYENSLASIEAESEALGMSEVDRFESVIEATRSAMVGLAEAGDTSSDEYRDLEANLSKLLGTLFRVREATEELTDAEREVRSESSKVNAWIEDLKQSAQEYEDNLRKLRMEHALLGTEELPFMNQMLSLMENRLVQMGLQFGKDSEKVQDFKDEVEKLRDEIERLETPTELQRISTTLDEISSVTNNLVSSMAEAASGVTSGIDTIVQGMGELSEAQDKAGKNEAWGTIIDGITNVAGALDSLLPQYDSAVNQMVEGAFAAGGAIAEIVTQIPGLGKAISALGSLASSVFGDMANGAKQVREALENAADGARFLTEATVESFKAIPGVVERVSRGGFLGAIGLKKDELQQEVFDYVMGIAEGVAGGLQSGLNSAIDAAIGGDQDWKQTFKDEFESAILQTIIDTFIESTILAQEFQEFIQEFTRLLTENDSPKKAFEWLEDNIDEVTDEAAKAIDEFVSYMPDRFKEGTEEALKATKENIDGIVNTITDGATIVNEAMARMFIDFATNNGAINEEVVNRMVELAKSVASGFESGLRQGIDAFLRGDDDWAQQLEDGITAAVTNALINAFIASQAVNAIMADFVGEFVRVFEESPKKAAEYARENIGQVISQLSNMVETFVSNIPDELLPSNNPRSTRYRPPETSRNRPEPRAPRPAGTRIDEITGPTRDLLVDLLRPLSIMPSWTSMIRDIRNDVRMIATNGGMAMPVIQARSPVAQQGAVTYNIYNPTITTQATDAQTLFRQISKFSFKERRGGK